ncbi:hypothetical protein [Taibaiella soli]|uniref:Uncharacterized protein n=1 Tax=Taibaiella soli TaxID=1649169 RepID=A0A2W2AW12_9BACT|nr:hypothetical protein [Taibaiella soli]PZF72164.1 hypothetical protein DN068_14615 [Taibaiella soli]
MSQTPKTNKTFPLDYKISRPSLEFENWDRDFDRFYAYLTPAIKKTQATLTSNDHGVATMLNPNSVLPHAQLDTATIVKDEKQLNGTWRMVAFRSMRFNDSGSLLSKQYYRLPDTLLEDKSADDAFAFINNGKYELYAKEEGKSKFKKKASAKYSIEGQRYLMMYKGFKASGGVSQFGIDENGYLIINYPSVIENGKKGSYISYFAVIQQFIFEKVQ